MGQNIVEPEQRGLGPLAVPNKEEIEPFREEFSFTKPFQELAKEFRRLAAAKHLDADIDSDFLEKIKHRAAARTWDEAGAKIDAQLEAELTDIRRSEDAAYKDSDRRIR